MGGYSAQTAADRAGVEPGQIVRLAELGISAPDDDVGYTDADLRRVQVVRALERAGLELEGLADLLREGSEAEWWRSEVQTLLPARGEPADELGRRSAEISPRLSRATDRALVAIYHAQQMHVWSGNIRTASRPRWSRPGCTRETSGSPRCVSST